MRLLQNAAIIATLGATVPAPAILLNLNGAPGAAETGAAISLQLNYQRQGNEEEQRLVFFIQMHALDGRMLEKEVFDNTSHGFENESGFVAASMTMPDEPVYFEGWAVPWSMNTAIVEQLESYPTDGTYWYQWAGGYGVTQDIYYLGSLIASAPGDNSTYCSGVAFETFVIGYQNYNSTYGHANIGGMSVANMQQFRRDWYGVSAGVGDALAAYAIPRFNLGERIDNWEEAQKGDAMQLWRTSGSGHNPVFIRWERDSQDKIIGVYYWGSQGSTDGIGYRNEFFSPDGDQYGIIKEQFHLARARKPRDQADYDWALATTSTEDAPTQLMATGGGGWTFY